MKRTVTTRMSHALMTLLLALCSTVAYAQNNNGDNKTVVFTVSMHCSLCKKKIDNNVKNFTGVNSMTSDLSERTVVITYNPQKTNVNTLMKDIEKLGFKVKIKQNT